MLKHLRFLKYNVLQQLNEKINILTFSFNNNYYTHSYRILNAMTLLAVLKHTCSFGVDSSTGEPEGLSSAGGSCFNSGP